MVSCWLCVAHCVLGSDLIIGTNESPVATNFTSGTNAFDNTYVGYVTNAAGNSLGVFNAGTLLTNTQNLFVGYEGADNSVVVSNGGDISVGNLGEVGKISDGNSVLVTGDGSSWANGGFFILGGQGSDNSVTIGSGAQMSAASFYIGSNSIASNNSALISGNSSLLFVTDFLQVGRFGSGNSLVISDGGRVAANASSIRNTQVGAAATASNNLLLVTGTGSLLTNAGDFYVGAQGSGNSLVVSNGGSAVTSGPKSYIGYETNSGHSAVLVVGAGSSWTNSGILYVGTFGSSNTANVTGAGTVKVGGATYVGASNSAQANSVLVSGAGSLWTNAGTLYVGYAGTASRLVVADGATVAADNITIASAAGSSGELDIGRPDAGDVAGNLVASSIAFGAGSGALAFHQTNTFTLSATVSGAGTVRQLGLGTTTLTGPNTYSGSTVVSNGVLIINGNQSAATGSVTVGNGGILGGSGVVGGQVTVSLGGTLSPGNSPGVLTATNGLSLSTGSNFEWDLIGNSNSGRGSIFDGVNVSGGNLSIGAGVTSALLFNATNSTVSWADTFWGANQSWLVFSNANLPTLASGSIFDTITLTADINTLQLNDVAGRENASFSWSQVGSDVYLNYNAVPEPSTYALLALAAAGLGAQVLRCRRK